MWKQSKSIFYRANGSTVFGDNACLGGIVGALFSGAFIDQCYNTGEVTGKHPNGNLGIFNVGGIVGFCYDSVIQNTYNVGNVYGSESVGGIVGYFIRTSTSTDINISNSYNASTQIQGSAGVGNFGGYTEKAKR